MNNRPDLSVVIPLFNEEKNLPLLLPTVSDTLNSLNVGWEIILTDDGSTDNTAKLIRDFVVANPRNCVKGIILNRNWGQHCAVTAGMENSSGRYVITMDGDMQNPPGEIPKVLAELQKGYDVVGTWRQSRHDSMIRTLPSTAVNFFVRLFCHGLSMHDYGSMLRGYSDKVVNAIIDDPGRPLFVPILAMKFAKNYTEMPVNHLERYQGNSKYSFWKLIKLFWHLCIACINLYRPAKHPSKEIIKYEIKEIFVSNIICEDIL